MIADYLRKRRAVVRVLDGESVDAVAAEVGVPPGELEEWRRAYLAEELWEWPRQTAALVLVAVPVACLVFALTTGDVIPKWAWWALGAISLFIALSALRVPSDDEAWRDQPERQPPADEVDERSGLGLGEIAGFATLAALGGSLVAGAPVDLIAFAVLAMLTVFFVAFAIREIAEKP